MKDILIEIDRLAGEELKRANLDMKSDGSLSGLRGWQDVVVMDRSLDDVLQEILDSMEVVK